MVTGVFLEDEPIEIVGALEDKEGYALSDVTLQAVLDKAGVDYEWLDFSTLISKFCLRANLRIFITKI